MGRVRIRTCSVAVALLFVCSLLTATRAGAAGITTHGWMAVEAIDHVSNPALRNLLDAHRDQVRAGASFPDVGYVGSNTYGEEAHWQRFVDNYLDLIAARTDCGVLTDPSGPCADMIAHAFGAAAHGMGDEVWDWLFEPTSADLDEYYVSDDVPTTNEGGAETQMDLVAIGRYGVPRPVTPPLPDIPTLLAAFDASGLHGVTGSQFDLVPHLPSLWDIESGWADAHLADVETAMPWMADNLVTAPGGVNFASVAIAGYWSTMWGRLNGNQPATSVSITYPAPGQTDIPATGWDRASFRPGSSRSGGGARTRIAAALTSARPYVPGGGGRAVSNEMPAGTMTITDVTTGAAVPIKGTYPRSVPYGSDSGEHVIDVQPAGNLNECTWYRVDVGDTTPLLDARGLAVTPYSWTFRTVCANEPPDTTVPGEPTTTTPPAATPTTKPVTPVKLAASTPHGVAPTSVNALPATPVAAIPAYTG